MHIYYYTATTVRCLGKWSSSSFMLIKQRRDAFRGGTWSCSVSSLLLLSLSLPLTLPLQLLYYAVSVCSKTRCAAFVAAAAVIVVAIVFVLWRRSFFLHALLVCVGVVVCFCSATFGSCRCRSRRAVCSVSLYLSLFAPQILRLSFVLLLFLLLLFLVLLML